MINHTAIRIGIVVAAILAIYGTSRWIGQSIEPRAVEMPRWTFNELPKEWGDWHGDNTELDPKIFVATQAEIVVNRSYRDSAGHGISMHTAMYKNPAHGVYHSPMNCYRSGGWQRIKTTDETLHLKNGATLPIRLVTYERDNRRILIAYWYQLGEHVLFDRFDLGVRVRWSLSKNPKWPALIKVLLEIPIADPAETRSTLVGFAENLATWVNQPSHQTGLKPKTVSTAKK
jgi:EpsI family protein